MSLTGTCWVEGCSFVRNGTRIKSFWCEFSENACCNLTETREGFLSLEIFWKFFPNLPQFIKNWLQQRYFQGIFRNRILHSNFHINVLHHQFFLGKIPKFHLKTWKTQYHIMFRSQLLLRIIYVRLISTRWGTLNSLPTQARNSFLKL